MSEDAYYKYIRIVAPRHVESCVHLSKWVTSYRGRWVQGYLLCFGH